MFRRYLSRSNVASNIGDTEGGATGEIGSLRHADNNRIGSERYYTEVSVKGYLSFCLIFLVFVSRGLCQEPDLITLENVSSAKRIVADEPLRKRFSAEQAARYLDNTSLAWQKRRNCVTCHTNMAYLMARPALSEVLKDSGEVRGFFESYFMERWEKGETPPKHAYNPVVVGSALAFNDVQTSGKLYPPFSPSPIPSTATSSAPRKKQIPSSKDTSTCCS